MNGANPANDDEMAGTCGYMAHYAPQLAAAAAAVAALPPAHRASFQREIDAFMRERTPGDS